MPFNFDPELEIEKDDFDHLENIEGTDLWKTPGDSADPRDCDRYPDSPWCGGQPWSRNPVGLDFDVDISRCYVGVSVTPTIGYTAMPVQEIYWLSPGCREKEIELAKPRSKPVKGPRGDLNRYVCVIANYTVNWRRFKSLDKGAYILHDQYIHSGKSGGYDWDKEAASSYPHPTFYLEVSCLGSTEYKITNYKNSRPDYYGSALPEEKSASRSSILIRFSPTEIHLDVLEAEENATNPNAWKAPIPNVATRLLDPTTTDNAGPFVIRGLYGHCLRWLQLIQDRWNWVKKFSDGNAEIMTGSVTVTGVINLTPIKKPPPPPPPRRRTKEDEDEEMKCCDQVIRRLARIEKAIGVRDLPVTLPELLSRKSGKDAKNAKDDSLTKLLVRQIQYFDDLMGQWEIPIEIEDSDLLTDGNQKKTINLPNLAEAIAEMFGLVFSTSMNVEASLQLLVKSMMTQSQDLKVNIESRYLAEAIADYLGFPRNEKKKLVDILINPKAPDLDDFYDPSQMEVIVSEYEEKENLKHDLKQLLLAAAITKAQGTRSFNPRLDMAAQILDLLKKNSGAIDDVERGVGKDKDKDDFDNFLEEAERGFIDTPGITDTVNPYGKPYSQRPRIREIGGNAGGT